MERQIEFLRSSFIQQEKTRKIEEARRKKEASTFNNKLKAGNASGIFTSKEADFSTDASGSFIHVNKIHPSKLRPIIRTVSKKVAEETIITQGQTMQAHNSLMPSFNSLVSTIKEIEPIEKKDSVNLPPVINAKKEGKNTRPGTGAGQTQKKEGDLSEISVNKMADLSRVEPSYGVIIKLSSGTKKGGSFYDNPKVKNLTSIGFHQSNIKNYIPAAEARPGTTFPQSKYMRKNAQVSGAVPRNEFLENLDMGDLLVRENKMTKNESFLANVPSNSESFTKKRGASTAIGRKRKTERVIIAKDQLAKDLEVVETSAIIRPKTAIRARIPERTSNFFILRNYLESSERKVRERRRGESGLPNYRL